MDLRSPSASSNNESSAIERGGLLGQDVFKIDFLELTSVSANNGDWAGRLVKVNATGEAGR